MALQKQQIIQSALELLDQDGLEGVTLRKVAGRLGVQAPALYWHVKNKGWLVDEMAEAMLQTEFANINPRRGDEDWRRWLREHLLKLRKAMLSRRDGARVVAGAHLYPAVTLARFAEVALVSLESAGMDLQRARLIVTSATHYTFGHVIEEQAAPPPEVIEAMDVKAFAAHYPTLIRAVKHVWEADFSPEQWYVDGLNLILDDEKPVEKV